MNTKITYTTHTASGSLLNRLKLYLGISDNKKDELLELLLDMACSGIKGYLNMGQDVWLDNSFNNAIIKLAAYYYGKRGEDGVTQMTQGSRYKAMTQDIPQDIKTMLPLPKVRIM